MRGSCSSGVPALYVSVVCEPEVSPGRKVGGWLGANPRRGLSLPDLHTYTDSRVELSLFVLRRADEEKQLHPEVGGISLGDATCLAVAKRPGLRVVASDSAWKVLETGVEVLPFR